MYCMQLLYIVLIIVWRHGVDLLLEIMSPASPTKCLRVLVSGLLLVIIYVQLLNS